MAAVNEGRIHLQHSGDRFVLSISHAKVNLVDFFRKSVGVRCTVVSRVGVSVFNLPQKSVSYNIFWRRVSRLLTQDSHLSSLDEVGELGVVTSF